MARAAKKVEPPKPAPEQVHREVLDKLLGTTEMASAGYMLGHNLKRLEAAGVQVETAGARAVFSLGRGYFSADAFSGPVSEARVYEERRAAVEHEAETLKAHAKRSIAAYDAAYALGADVSGVTFVTLGGGDKQVIAVIAPNSPDQATEIAFALAVACDCNTELSQ